MSLRKCPTTTPQTDQDMPNTPTKMEMNKKQHETLCQHNMIPLFYHGVSKLPDAGNKYPSRHPPPTLQHTLAITYCYRKPSWNSITNQVSTSYYNSYSSFHLMNSYKSRHQHFEKNHLKVHNFTIKTGALHTSNNILSVYRAPQGNPRRYLRVISTSSTTLTSSGKDLDWGIRCADEIDKLTSV